MEQIIYIPNGPKNLAGLFHGINWNNVASYYVEVLEALTNATIATTTLNKIGCCCSDDKIRLVFVNYLGGFDAVNFQKPSVNHETKFGEFEKGLPNVLRTTDTGGERFDITSNDIHTCSTNCYNEEHMLWLQELADSPKVYMEWTGIQGQEDSYLPVTIISTNFLKVKNKDDFRYEFTVQFKLSNEFLILRN